MTDDVQSADPRRGQSLRGSGATWSAKRLAANLSLTELAERAGIPRSTVGLIDQGRLVPSPDEAAAILRVLADAAPA